ncbi:MULTISPECIES: hypothetical protein [unclassified Rhizobium]|nr:MULTISPECIES: hypothetical protein [unclassified Rhizobium]
MANAFKSSSQALLRSLRSVAGPVILAFARFDLENGPTLAYEQALNSDAL